MAKKEKKKTFGQKLKKLREKEGLSIEELSSQLDMKPSYLLSLEEDKLLPPVAEIIKLAGILAVEPSSFMEEERPKASKGRRRKAHEVRTKEYAYETLTTYEHGLHLMAFQVSIESGSTHHKVGYKHEGEEFIYVVSGKLNIKIGRKSQTLGPGECIHFDSGKKHVLRNPGREPTSLLVVIYTP